MDYLALGLMSGSSLDGLDLAYCRLSWEAKTLKSWELLTATTLPFEEKWRERLRHLSDQSASTLARTHTYFGHYTASLVNEFLSKHSIKVLDFIASHGHTVFHDPSRKTTTQIGCGATIAALTGYPVICDFRTSDVALEGQGAPLAPIADELLFPNYAYYLNLGGIANLSSPSEDGFVGFDVCYANQGLNLLASLLGTDFDHHGNWASTGSIDHTLLQQLMEARPRNNKLRFSLSNTDFHLHFAPLLLNSEKDIPDRLATFSEYIARNIAEAIQQLRRNGLNYQTPQQILCTGGGVLNHFLMKRIQSCLTHAQLSVEVVIPQTEVIQFKEALLMALLGAMRLLHLPNSPAYATGALRSTIGGCIYQGTTKLI